MQTLNRLVQSRYLISDDDEATLWLSPMLRNYVYAQQSAAMKRTRHERIARHYAVGAAGHSIAPLLAAHHFLEAGRQSQAAEVLLAAADELIEELEIDDLRAALQRLQESVDRRFETRYGLVTGALIGIVGGMYNLLRQALQVIREEQKRFDDGSSDDANGVA